jgi:hypothetical protein
MVIEQNYLKQPICNAKIELKSWVILLNFAALGIFVINGVSQLFRMLKFKSQKSNKAITMFQISLALLLISIIAGSSHFLTFILSMRGVCRDALGYFHDFYFDYLIFYY